MLAQCLGWVSGRGWCPFDPVSMFLLQGWQVSSDWNRAQTLRNLHKPRYADYAGRLDFLNFSAISACSAIKSNQRSNNTRGGPPHPLLLRNPIMTCAGQLRVKCKMVSVTQNAAPLLFEERRVVFKTKQKIIYARAHRDAPLIC